MWCPLYRGFVDKNACRLSGHRGCRYNQVNLVEKGSVHENLSVTSRVPLYRGPLYRGSTVFLKDNLFLTRCFSQMVLLIAVVC